MDARLRRFLLSLTAVFLAMSINAAAADAGGVPGGSCGVCMDFTECEELVDYFAGCDPATDPTCEDPAPEDPCGVACNEMSGECTEFHPNCFDPEEDFQTWIECGDTTED